MGLEISLYTIIGILFIGITIILGIRYSMKKERNSKKIPKDIKDQFVEIKKFNENQYIEDTFSTIFHSVQIDNWRLLVSDKEITFSKNPDGIDSVWDRIDLKVKYKIKNGKFIISEIYLSAGTFFTHKGELKENDYKFFYQKYADYKNELNVASKANCDESMKKIHKIVGKASIRDAKIDDILNR
jgi:hypothetical protein